MQNIMFQIDRLLNFWRSRRQGSDICPLQSLYVVISKRTHTAVTCVITSSFYDPFIGNWWTYQPFCVERPTGQKRTTVVYFYLDKISSVLKTISERTTNYCCLTNKLHAFKLQANQSVWTTRQFHLFLIFALSILGAVLGFSTWKWPNTLSWL